MTRLTKIVIGLNVDVTTAGVANRAEYAARLGRDTTSARAALEAWLHARDPVAVISPTAEEEVVIPVIIVKSTAAVAAELLQAEKRPPAVKTAFRL